MPSMVTAQLRVHACDLCLCQQTLFILESCADTASHCLQPCSYSSCIAQLEGKRDISNGMYTGSFEDGIHSKRDDRNKDEQMRHAQGAWLTQPSIARVPYHESVRSLQMAMNAVSTNGTNQPTETQTASN